MASYPDPPNEEPCGLCLTARAAFTLLYHQHALTIYRYFYHQIGHVQDAQDLTATTFTTALSRFAHYQPQRASLAAWLFGVAHNCFREYRRGRRSVEQLTSDVLDAEALPEWHLLSTERNVALHQAIRELPVDQRDALALRFFGELRTSEVAAVLGKTDGAVKMLVHRAMMTLRDYSAREGWQ